VNTDQVLIGAIAAVVLILIAVGVGRAMVRRRGANEDDFGAGGKRQVPLGTRGVAKTALAPSGVVLAAGEQWTANSASGARIEPGQRVRVVGQDGLTLIVDVEPASGPAGA
jgi:membrane-bound serine protease (ClpP class)